VLFIKNVSGRFIDMSGILISRDSSGSTVTKLRAGRPRNRGWVGGSEWRQTHKDRFWDPPSLLFKGYWGSKRPGHEADLCPPCSAKVRLNAVMP